MLRRLTSKLARAPQRLLLPLTSSSNFIIRQLLRAPIRPALLQPSAPRTPTLALPKSVLRYQPTPQDTQSFQECFQYIKNNRQLLPAVEAIKANHPKLTELSQAIDAGQAEAEIFSDPDCDLYLLSLIQKGKLGFWPGMTVYAYLTALRQFTQRQALKSEDEDIKFDREVCVTSLAAGGKLSPFGRLYVETVCEKLQAFAYDLAPQTLEAFILKSAPCEQWLLQIHYDRNEEKAHEKRTAIFLRNTFWILPFKDKTNGRDYYLYPASTLMNFILSKVSDKPLRMMPVFGSLKAETLLKLHERNIHPVALYSPRVVSNLKTEDGYRRGPWNLYIHDWSHGQWGSMLVFQDRELLFSQFIPPLQDMIKHLLKAKIPKTYTISRIQDIINDANDFDLTDIRTFTCSQTRLLRYLKRTFRRDPGPHYPFSPDALFVYPAHNPDSNLQAGFSRDDLLLVMLLNVHRRTPLSDRGLELWEALIESIEVGDSFRSTDKVNEIRSLARCLKDKSAEPVGVTLPRPGQ